MKIIFINDKDEIRFIKNDKTFESQIKAFFYIKSSFKIRLKEFYVGNYDSSETALLRVKDFSNLSSGNDIDIASLKVVNGYLQYKRAIAFAKKKHKEQKYSELKLPYFYHLRQVDKVLDYFYPELPDNYYFILKTCAILHDTVEDTGTKSKEVEAEFGKEIAEIVDMISKKKKLTRGLTDKCYFKQMLKNPYTIIVKIADKCANFKQTKKNMARHHVKRVSETYEPFKKYTYDKVDVHHMKDYLEKIVQMIKRKI